MAAASGVLLALWHGLRARDAAAWIRAVASRCGLTSVVETLSARRRVLLNVSTAAPLEPSMPPPTPSERPEEVSMRRGSTMEQRGAAGHAGNLVQDGFFFKREVKNRFENEREFLQRLREGDAITPFAPEFLGVESLEGARYLKMRHFLLAFDEASLCQMHIKMGVRCFAEGELQSKKPRKDLYERLRKMDASVLTADEVAQGSITKARWMQLRDGMSSTKALGFRVDGVVTPESRRSAFGDLATVRAEADVVQALRSFVRVGAGLECSVCQQVLSRLDALEAALLQSTLFWQSELIGSSLLFAADGTGRVGVWMLDFGLTTPSPVGALRHDEPWALGNHEDGYLLGVRNLRRLWQQLLEEDTWHR